MLTPVYRAELVIVGLARGATLPTRLSQPSFQFALGAPVRQNRKSR